MYCVNFDWIYLLPGLVGRISYEPEPKEAFCNDTSVLDFVNGEAIFDVVGEQCVGIVDARSENVEYVEEEDQLERGINFLHHQAGLGVNVAPFGQLCILPREKSGHRAAFQPDLGMVNRFKFRVKTVTVSEL